VDRRSRRLALQRQRRRAISTAFLCALIAVVPLALVGLDDDAARPTISAAAAAPVSNDNAALGPLLWGAPPLVPEVSQAVAAHELVEWIAAEERRLWTEGVERYHREQAEIAAYLDGLARARRPAPTPAARPLTVDDPVPSSAFGCDEVHWAAREIYMRESGCNPASVNGGGCRGIGQACPGSKLPCGADFACQHAWFTGYAMSRYGSWEAAWAAWQRQHWW
jgi:hypothetical protein